MPVRKRACRGRRRIATKWLAGLLIANASCFPARAGDLVDLQLVIAADVSTSMDAQEKALQQQGFAKAFRRPEIIEAITGGRNGRIAVTYVEWGGDGQRRVVVPWTIIANEADAWLFSLKLEANSPAKIRQGTSISGILSYADYLIRFSGFDATRSLINISGDGVNNKGLEVEPVRAGVLANGITINALPIVYDAMQGGEEEAIAPEDLIAYFRREVIGGPGAFAEAVAAPEQYSAAIYRKLLREISNSSEVAAAAD
ncbi:DUF1194 domain-containing protein [Rhizobium sp. P32RR-XVIII]|uniref:DUF1194 domain-containing protein n=1 Tax=Rhizobium sp. P32RR-XVIII TaxID=2726738 RepID=UPI0014564CED|nr:DUF1194 domain-containing protein [Rhizobium sp. P32RR-XVIII]NLS03172.1 DUF1194 domain-containing protein [Rhizobium sp. P32RR-XVIII]